MLSVKLLLFVLVGTALASDIGSLIADQIGEVVPPETRKFYNSLTSTDKGVLEDVLSNINRYTNASDLLDDLKDRSLPLFNKGTEYLNIFRETLDKLSEKAKLFIDQEIAQARRVFAEPFSVPKMRDELNGTIRRYRALDEDTKFELKNAFPTIAQIVYNPILQAIATSVLGIGTEPVAQVTNQ
uniref:Fatty-acid and retinol-binding protein 1 n=1 Tax=Steinernema glaseri TaxID=37863 RepID=A0A1I7YRS9_9BILA